MSWQEDRGSFERIRLAQAGNEAMQDAVVADHLDLVRSVVKRFGLRGEEWDDLFQIGCVGLIKAIQRFDLTREVRFSSYAVPMIVGELKQYFRENQKIHISRSLRTFAQTVREREASLGDKLKREPTVKEIAASLNVTVSRIAEAMEAMCPIRSLDEVIACQAKGDSRRLGDEVAISAVCPDDEDRLLLSERMEKLPPREREIIKRRFWQDMTQAQIARRLGISQVQVSRLEKKALLFLREGNKTGKTGER